MNELAWSAFLFSTGLLAYFGAGRRSRRVRIGAGGVQLVSEAGWMAYGWQSGGYFFTGGAVLWSAAAIGNIWTAWWDGRDAPRLRVTYVWRDLRHWLRARVRRKEVEVE